MAIRLDPDHVLAHVGRAGAYSAKQEFDRAVADYTRVIGLDPKNRNSLYGRGNAYRILHDYDRAIADYSETITLDPNDAAAHAGRAASYLAERDYEKAVADYSEVVRLDPKNRDAFYNRAIGYSARKEFDRANRLLRRPTLDRPLCSEQARMGTCVHFSRFLPSNSWCARHGPWIGGASPLRSKLEATASRRQLHAGGGVARQSGLAPRGRVGKKPEARCSTERK